MPSRLYYSWIAFINEAPRKAITIISTRQLFMQHNKPLFSINENQRNFCDATIIDGILKMYFSLEFASNDIYLICLFGFYSQNILILLCSIPKLDKIQPGTKIEN